MILVVIPYLAAAAQGCELELAVAGWRQHFKEEHRIVVVGDDPHIDGVEFIPCPAVEPIPGQQPRTHIDHVHKFRTVRRFHPEGDGFIYACDDMYAVRDFTLEDVQAPKIKRDHIIGTRNHWNIWTRNNVRTRELLLSEGLPARNWVCHLPVWYEWDKLLAIYDRYDCDHVAYVVEQLYFNTYQPDVPAVVMDSPEDVWCFRIWTQDVSPEDVKDAMTRKTWLVNSVGGWSPWLERMLRDHYGLLDHA